MDGDVGELGVFVVLRAKTYFIPGDQEKTLTKIEAVLQDHGVAVPEYEISPDEIINLGGDDIRSLVSTAVTIVKGRKRPGG
jgi:hypothetical protein